MGTYIVACDYHLAVRDYTDVEKVAEIYPWCSPEEIYTRDANGIYLLGNPNGYDNFFDGDVSYSYFEDLQQLVSLCTAGSFVVVRDCDEGASWYKVWKDDDGVVRESSCAIYNPFDHYPSEPNTNDCVLTLDEDDIISCIDVDDYAKLSEAELRKVIACANRNYKAAILNAPELLIDSVNDAVHECTNL